MQLLGMFVQVLHYRVGGYADAHSGLWADIAIALHGIGIEYAGDVSHKHAAIQRFGHGGFTAFIFYVTAGFRQQTAARIKTRIRH